MDRETIEATLRDVYAARARGDARETLRHFTDHATFALVSSHPGNPTGIEVAGRHALHEAVDGLVQSFEFHNPELVQLLVDGSMAAAHIRVRVRAPSTGREVTTELLELIRFEGEKIADYRQFCDTALASWLLAPDAPA